MGGWVGVHSHRVKTIDAIIPTKPGRGTSGLRQPGGSCLFNHRIGRRAQNWRGYITLNLWYEIQLLRKGTPGGPVVMTVLQLIMKVGWKHRVGSDKLAGYVMLIR